MLAAIGQLLPIAAAAAISSVPISVMLMILLSPRRSESAVPFLIGWLIGVAGTVTLFAWGASLVPSPSENASGVLLGVGELLIGVALIAAGVLAFRQRGGEGATKPGGWFARMDAVGPVSAFALALVLNVRPKALLLACAAGLVLRGASLSLAHTALVIGVYAVVAGSTIAVPIVMTLVSPQRMEPRLVDAKAWLHRHARVISAVVLLMVGVVAIGNGLTRV